MPGPQLLKLKNKNLAFIQLHHRFPEAISLEILWLLPRREEGHRLTEIIDNKNMFNTVYQVLYCISSIKNILHCVIPCLLPKQGFEIT